ncbi:unnamed protein product [Adineta steineri]|uniref:PWWP domain-containing protein n=1 Tax=Adineta steineri TaxID=433720 RepID=A0A819E1I4_9BILA|nr:unnamed protein product [Adineta steineri]CAF3843028.1 unnamed protein product [Adineta steineri]
MDENLNVEEPPPPTNRRSVRSCRLSIVKPKPSIEKKIEEPIPIEDEIEQEDPPDIYQIGDIFWVRVAGNPWWPALIYGSYYEDNIHTKILKTNHRGKKRSYFLYFFGPTFEYIWTAANLLVPYSGLDEFIRHAETSVQNATTKGEQEALANRFELKVAANKRAQWDKAIEEADQAFKLTREDRIKNFDEILKKILSKAEKNKSNKRRHSSVATTGQTRKTLSPSADKTSNRSSVKRQKTKLMPTSSPPTLLHVGLPTLTKREEKRLVTDLLNHSKNEELTLNEALSFTCQLVTNIVKENSHYDMSCVQIEWFYDFLQKYPDIIFKYSHWFNEDIKPIEDDPIYFKQCQIKSLIENSKN